MAEDANEDQIKEEQLPILGNNMAQGWVDNNQTLETQLD